MKSVAEPGATHRGVLKSFDSGRADLSPARDPESAANAPELAPDALRPGAWAAGESRRSAPRHSTCREMARCLSAFHRATRRSKIYRRANRPDRRAPAPEQRKLRFRKARRLP